MTIASTLTGSGYEVALMNAAAGGFTWAGKPAATAVPVGTMIRITDFGVPFLLMVSDGTRWVPAGQQLLARAAVPVNHTGTTSETAIATVVVPAGAMGLSGGLLVNSTWTITNSANNKITRIRLGGLAGGIVMSTTNTTQASINDIRRIRNRASASSQVASSSNSPAVGTSSSAVATAAVDTSVAVDLAFTGTLGLGTETITLENYEVWLTP